MKFEADVDVITRINECYSKMSKGKKNIATYICDHYEQAVFMTAAELGKIVGMSAYLKVYLIKIIYAKFHL